MEFSELIKERYSVRDFKKEMIKEETLKKIYQAAMLAPTGKNIQPQMIYVLKDEDSLNRLSKLSRCIYGAPVAMICGFNKDLSWKNVKSGEDAGVQDTTIAVTHMMLEAWNQKVGSCWVNLYDSRMVKKEFNLPDNFEMVCILILGYPSDDAKPIDMHFQSKEIKDVFIEI